MYAVHGNCAFDVLPYFDVIKCLPPDVMHDLLEGVIPLVMKLVICKAHTEKHITINEVNDELKHINLGKNDRQNKPVELSETILRNSGIAGSASQIWCLFRPLPFLMAHHIPTGSQYWYVFLLCSEIVAMATEVRKDELAHLNLLVEEFLVDTAEVFGDVLTPKCHFLIHYSRLLLMFGPLRPLWCMRFESKHQYFKNIVENCRNFVNITATLSSRHQMKQCWEFSSNSLLGDFDYTLSKGISLPFSCLPSRLQKTLKLNQKFENVHFEDKVLQRVSSVSINAVRYALEDVFVVGHVHTEAIPLFFKAKYILNVDTLWVLCGKLLVPKSYESHFHA